MVQLTRKEEKVMRALWKLQKAFVKEIMEEMNATSLPYNTVSSIVRKLESQGLIGHDAFGKTHRYFPILQEQQYKKKSIKEVLDHYFGGSPAQLLSYFVEEEALSPEELEELLSNLKS